MNTIPDAEARKLAREARRHACDTTAELFSAPTVEGPGGGHGGFDPTKAERN